MILIIRNCMRILLGRLSLFALLLCHSNSGIAQAIQTPSGLVNPVKLQDKNPDELKVGAQQTEKYFPLIKGKSVAVVAHPASLVGNIHLVDTLICSGMNVKK